MTADTLGLVITSIVVSLVAFGGVVLTAQRGFQSASLDAIVKQYQAVSQENMELRTERDNARAEADRWRKAFEACEKRLPAERRRRASRDGDN